MREKYETLALKDLKALAKIRGIKGYSTMSKEEIVDAMVAKDEEEALSKAAKEPEKEAKEASKAKKT
ncbi:MAG: Rho termination factor N-terminal domain-containing protein, partial [Lachnospiraceae bacterium]|nr:Rho termination factor N-terminal domain-containing protein [Lachnospiraceae bacterium]